MTRIFGVFLALALGIGVYAPCALSQAVYSKNAVGFDIYEKEGVYCEINEVKLFALSTEDCSKAGGAVTHTVTTTVKPTETEKE
jgi:hypothetical protein